MRVTGAAGASPAYHSGIHPGQITAEHAPFTHTHTYRITAHANACGFNVREDVGDLNLDNMGQPTHSTKN